ncbi:Leukocyte receptor cluster member 1 [Intoshia linei]|uniref:Leukocyte receptor cluster member 1 n=1 Tax=Intoshia linei TaxID=1819745 RepID=A0A177B8A8_9BILA|nr:Leukocyte receptor cluster member 1 [Intoshia linei]
MNILPKKNWHVRRKENVAKVRKDEREAAALEVVDNERKTNYKKESKMQELRKKSKTNEKSEPNSSYDVDENIKRHFNFFDNCDNTINTKGNKEFEKDAKKDLEAVDRKIGVLTYLGQSVIESQKSKRWFENIPTDRKDLSIRELDEIKDASHKSRRDPLNSIKAYEKFLEADKLKNNNFLKPRLENEYIPNDSIVTTHSKRKHRCCKKKRKDKTTKPTIQELRQNRIDREKQEHFREAELIKYNRTMDINRENENSELYEVPENIVHVDIESTQGIVSYMSSFDTH